MQLSTPFMFLLAAALPTHLRTTCQCGPNRHNPLRGIIGNDAYPSTKPRQTQCRFSCLSHHLRLFA